MVACFIQDAQQAGLAATLVHNMHASLLIRPRQHYLWNLTHQSLLITHVGHPAHQASAPSAQGSGTPGRSGDGIVPRRIGTAVSTSCTATRAQPLQVEGGLRSPRHGTACACADRAARAPQRALNLQRLALGRCKTKLDCQRTYIRMYARACRGGCYRRATCSHAIIWDSSIEL